MAKKLKIKLPKRIGGVKVPKQVRKGPVAEFLNSGAGQVLLGQALLFAAGAVTAKRTSSDSMVGNFLRDSIDGLRGDHSKGDHSGRLQFAFAEAARAFRSAMQNYSDDEVTVGRNEPDVVDIHAPTGEGSKKKTSRSGHPDASSTPH